MIYLVLHGETEWNRQRRFQGRLDSPLTSEGLEQARQVGRTLAHLVRDASTCRIISSPLGRSRRTAEIVCEAMGVPIERLSLDARLMEIDLGSWAGLTREEVEAKWPRPLAGANRYDWYFRSPDGEPLETASARLREWLSDTDRNDATAIAVSHGVASRILRGLYANIPMGDALALEVSRDVVFKLADGIIQRIQCQTD